MLAAACALSAIGCGADGAGAGADCRMPQEACASGFVCAMDPGPAWECMSESALPDGGVASGLIGPQGGEISLGEVTLVIPEGALRDPTDIAIARSDTTFDGYELVSGVYVFEPDGLTFDVPASLEVTFTGSPPDALRLYHGESSDGPLDEVVATRGARSMTANIDGFSLYTLAMLLGQGPDLGQFEADGHTYSSLPVDSGNIAGFGYDLVGQAEFNDGAGAGGQVWYDDTFCMTFRHGGQGITDARGGRDAHLTKFPWLDVQFAPGGETAPTANHYEDRWGGGYILDPQYDRHSDHWAFQWGVRLEADGTIYTSSAGAYEFYMLYTDPDAPYASGPIPWDVNAGPRPSYNSPVDNPTLAAPLDQHFCSFRKLGAIVVGQDQTRCIDTDIFHAGVAAVKTACYADGFMVGDYLIESTAGVGLEGGRVQRNAPVGPWTLTTSEGRRIGGGMYSDAGLQSGLWSFFVDGVLDLEATFAGGTPRMLGQGYVKVLEGYYREYFEGNLRLAGTLREGERSLFWNTYAPGGTLLEGAEYDHTVQLPTGYQTCFADPMGDLCVEHTDSWHTRTLRYDWGGCNPGDNVLQESTYDRAGNRVLLECFELGGTGEAPLRGAARTCPGICSS